MVAPGKGAICLWEHWAVLKLQQGKEKVGGVEDSPSICSWNVSEVVMSGWLHAASDLSFGGQ